MNIFGLTITRTQSEKAMTQPAGRGWWRGVLESFSGAWQQNVEVKLDSVLAYSTVYACHSRISGDIAKLRPKSIRRAESGVWEEYYNPAYSDLLLKPNSYQTRIEFFQHWMLCKLAHGNVHVLKQRDGAGRVEALHVLDPRRVRVLVSDMGDVFYELQQDYLSGLQAASMTVPAREIIHDKMNTVHHPLVGTSPIYACGLAAVQGLRIQNNSATFFGNGARPGGVLTAPGEIKQATAERLKEYWDANFTGEKVGKVAVLGDGLKYEPMMMTAEDAQLIEQLKWSAETVASCYNIPAFMVGAAPVPANSNVEALTTMYYSQCLQVLIESVEVCLDEGLDLPFYHGVEFDLDDLMRMDTATKVKSLAEAVGAGLMAPNEGRRRLDLPPVVGGETPYLQQQNFSLAALDARDRANPLGPASPSELPVPAIEQDVTDRAIAAVRMKFGGQLYAGR